jgi:peptide/nickel transport system permease protein
MAMQLERPLTSVATLSQQASPRAASQAAIVWRNFRRNPGALWGIGILTALVVLALLAPWIAPYDPTKPAIMQRLQPPSRVHLFGTDQFGRDTFSRVLYGGRTSLWLGIVAVGLSAVIGGVLGLTAGYYRGGIDLVISRLIDLMLAMPRILLALVIVFTLGLGVTNVMIAVGISGVPDYARLIRSSTMAAREHVYVEAAHVTGAPARRIMFVHILPNVVAPVVILGTLGLGTAILSAAGLSFLGLGAKPPVIEWGSMLSEGRQVLSVAWWLTTFPGLAILLAVLAVNLLGDGLRDALDPRLRRR